MDALTCTLDDGLAAFAMEDGKAVGTTEPYAPQQAVANGPSLSAPCAHHDHEHGNA